MNQEQLDQLARGLATAEISRWQVLKTLGATGVAGALAFFKEDSAEAAACRRPGARCSKRRECCSRLCIRGRCRCRAAGAGCIANRQCCSGVCSNGSCAAPAGAGCTMPASPEGCVKIGGGEWPFYYEGWFCPTSSCQSGYCAGTDLGQTGECGATATEIRDIVLSGEGQVLEGSLP